MVQVDPFHLLKMKNFLVWLTDIHCDTNILNSKNILQCNKSVYAGGNNHANDLILHCGGEFSVGPARLC